MAQIRNIELLRFGPGPPIMIKQTSDPRLIEMGANCSEDQARAGGVPAAPVLEELY